MTTLKKRVLNKFLSIFNKYSEVLGTTRNLQKSSKLIKKQPNQMNQEKQWVTSLAKVTDISSFPIRTGKKCSKCKEIRGAWQFSQHSLTDEHILWPKKRLGKKQPFCFFGINGWFACDNDIPICFHLLLS